MSQSTDESFNGSVASPPTRPVGPVTDLTKWRLTSVRGRQTWSYDEEGASGREPNFIERHAVGLDTVSEPEVFLIATFIAILFTTYMECLSPCWMMWIMHALTCLALASL